MTDEDEPITRGEWTRAMRDLNAQVQEVVREAVRAQAAAANPPGRGADSDLRREAEELRRELRERDRRELDEMRAELRSLREDQPDPLEQIGQARELVAALGPEPDSQLMQGLGVLSNVAEAYLEKREEAKESREASPADDASASPAEYGGPAEPRDLEIDSGTGPGAAPGFDFQVIEESG
jgi:hypothetical protein